MNSENLKVLTNVIGAVESGGQVYGNQRYDAYTPPYTNTSNEHTITLGWAQNYGPEAEKLIHMIYDTSPTTFTKLDTASPSIASMLGKDWAGIRWNPNASQKKALIALISSDVGKACQDKLFEELMQTFITDCAKDYTNNIKAQMMYCEIRHLGGKKSADRIFKRCNGNYSLDNIMAALAKDQDDTSSSNQVGDTKFWSRHVKCYQFIDKYAKEEKVITKADALKRAKILLRQPQGETMTGYTPTGKSYFVSAGAWYKVPQPGDVVYFYRSSKGRVGHTGIVKRVDTDGKMFSTIEGNTSSSEYAENGGCVAPHSYSYKNIGGTNRVNGFGRPNFYGAEVTADEFVQTAFSQIGYLEKASNSQLDSKTANAGSNNYQKFQRDVGAGNGDQWCQYFVDAIALYTCMGNISDVDPDTPTDVSTENVASGQRWLNENYGTIIKTYCGQLLEVDGIYGSRSRNAALAVWKDLMNRKFSSHLTPSNTNFGDSCKAFAPHATVAKGTTGTFTFICQFILSAYKCYTGVMDGECGNGTVSAIKQFQKNKGLTVDGSCGAETWYKLFN